jgi:hypothetical protein
MRSCLDDARDGPDLHEIARQVGRLAPSWQQPERFYRKCDDLADALHRLARRGQEERQKGPETRPRVPLVPPRERLAVLARALVVENARLRALLAAAARPPPRRRRRPPDARQLALL